LKSDAKLGLYMNESITQSEERKKRKTALIELTDLSLSLSLSLSPCLCVIFSGSETGAQVEGRSKIEDWSRVAIEDSTSDCTSKLPWIRSPFSSSSSLVSKEIIMSITSS
jgi:hypothetical protein